MDLIGTGFEEWVIPIIAAFSIALGQVLKQAIPKFPNGAIPVTLGVIGVVLNSWMNAWIMTPDILIVGFLSGVAGTGVFEVIRQVAKKKKQED